jgi:hypothetical protein
MACALHEYRTSSYQRIPIQVQGSGITDDEEGATGSGSLRRRSGKSTMDAEKDGAGMKKSSILWVFNHDGAQRRGFAQSPAVMGPVRSSVEFSPESEESNQLYVARFRHPWLF